MAKTAVESEFTPTHEALRPIKYHGKVYNAGELLDLDDESAANLGITAVKPYVVPLDAMTSAQLAYAAKEAAAREKLVADASKVAGAAK